MTADTITVVSGLPRSGTSMMMSMLEAGGLPLLTDHLRTADDSNPKGYYEYARVKALPTDDAWLDEAKGRAVKAISQLLIKLPSRYHYKVIFMRRHLDEILRSQTVMLERLGQPQTAAANTAMSAIFKKHLDDTRAWLATQPNMDVIYVSYNEILARPAGVVATINSFFDGTLDAGKMVAVVDHALHRQRAGA